ncbi:MAG: hypothetical protein F4047_10560 [Caldilineaceae bacterium SB0670_bin_27]|uniref:Uncharacterized protein n=1 Tax=Caldilineaceae bacterium SB0664_bin_27 TaxID=2605260 RepID=A0A6B0YPA9_9CHLR|nr:hypothetical protein [Caldilineaceae bacterium SB0664_bin_27]MYJ78565.1 hypothetical protein [Caldilineaceae bacterium SB0670_bin_27]
MPLPPLRRVFSFALLLTLLVGGCTQPVMWPVGATPTDSARSVDAAGLAELANQLAAESGLVQDLGPLVTVQPVATAGSEEPLFVSHTHGFPPDNPSFRQKVWIHTAGPDGWEALGRVELECAEYLNEFSVEQVFMDPVDLWLKVTGGVGAHSGCLELLRWDGENLSVIISGFSSSPDAGSVTDLDGDGQLDLLLNNSDPYIFCYACGVRQYWAQLFYWDGQRLKEVSPTPLADDQPAELRSFNNRAVDLAAASLFADALEQIERAEAIALENATVSWNAVWIRHHLEASREEASTSSFPLLNHVFAGDWETAFDDLLDVGMTTLVSDAPIPAGSAASGFEHVVGVLLAQFSDTALALQPERAAVHALGAWGRFLLEPNDPAVQSGMQLAAEFATEDSRFEELAEALESRPGTVAAAPAPSPLPGIQSLRERLASEYGSEQDPARGVAVQQLVSSGETTLFAANSFGLPPQSDSASHIVSIHEARETGWLELGREELDCVDYLDEHSLKQVSIEPSGLWLAVQGGAGAHGGCLEVLRWDGQRLSLVISSFNSIPDAGSIVDLNADGQLDLLLNNSDPYIFCYACGLQLYLARFFHWDGEKLVEAAPRLLPDDRPLHLRAINSHALSLAEAGLYADALDEIERAKIAAPADPTVHWNALWIRHHLDVSRQLAASSPFPLLSHVFAGDWDFSFEVLWAMGPSTLFSIAPIPVDSAAFGFDQTVGLLLTQYGNNALIVQPERADIHALVAWGRFLLDRDDPAVLAGLEKAAELAPGDSRIAALAAEYRAKSVGRN